MSSCIKDLNDYNLIKNCSKGGISSLKSHFYKDRTKKDGYRPECKNCSEKFCKKSYYDNQNRMLTNHKNYHKKIGSKINAYETQKREKLISILN